MGLSREAVEDAYRRYGHLVLRRCHFILRDGHAARDALQDVFMRLMKYGDSFAVASSPVGWLYRTADRTCFDILRRRRGVNELSDDGEVESDVTAPFTDAAAERDTVMRLLSHFDTKTQQVAVMYFLDELPQERIAEELGWSRQTVHAKLGLVRRRAAALKANLGVST